MPAVCGMEKREMLSCCRADIQGAARKEVWGLTGTHSTGRALHWGRSLEEFYECQGAWCAPTCKHPPAVNPMSVNAVQKG